MPGAGKAGGYCRKNVCFCQLAAHVVGFVDNNRNILKTINVEFLILILF